jgi:hypothetical protein
LEVQDVEEDEAFRVSPSSRGLGLDQMHMKLEDVSRHKRGLKFLQVRGFMGSSSSHIAEVPR